MLKRIVKDKEPACQCRRLPAKQKWVWSLGWEDPLEKGMETHSSVLVRRIPMDRGARWAIYSLGWQRVGHDWSDLSTHECMVHLNYNDMYFIGSVDRKMRSVPLWWTVREREVATVTKSQMSCTGFGNDFLDMTPRAQVTKEKTANWTS